MPRIESYYQNKVDTLILDLLGPDYEKSNLPVHPTNILNVIELRLDQLSNVFSQNSIEEILNKLDSLVLKLQDAILEVKKFEDTITVSEFIQLRDTIVNDPLSEIKNPKYKSIYENHFDLMDKKIEELLRKFDSDSSIDIKQELQKY